MVPEITAYGFKFLETSEKFSIVFVYLVIILEKIKLLLKFYAVKNCLYLYII